MSRRVWDCFPYWNEADMLQMHLEEVADHVHKVVICESPVTFGGDPKPLYYAENRLAFEPWQDKIIHAVADVPQTDNPWVREFAQRDAAWGALIDAGAELEDLVVIGDVDEILSPAALAWNGWPMCALQLRTTLYAVDWEVAPWYQLPPMTVLATVRWLKARGGQLAQVRQNRHSYPVLAGGGWHFSWVGGHSVTKLETGTSHKEIAGTQEEALIRSGMRYTHGASGPTGAPVEPVTVDGSWPAMIRERRCPPDWFRPEGSERLWVRPASADPAEISQYLWSGWNKGPLAFEVGANHGWTLPVLAQLCDRVIGFEPYPPNHKIASMAPGSDVRLAAVSDHDGSIILTLENDQLLSAAHEGYGRLGLDVNQVVTVPCVTLDSVAGDEGMPAFVNVDVEGHELEVLRGASSLLDAGVQWLIEFHSEDLHDQCEKLLADAGYRVETVRHPHYAPGSEFYLQHGWLKAVR